MLRRPLGYTRGGPFIQIGLT